MKEFLFWFVHYIIKIRILTGPHSMNGSAKGTLVIVYDTEGGPFDYLRKAYKRKALG